MSNQVENKIPTINDLLTHMIKHKDAVVIIGDKIESQIGKVMEPVIEGEESEQEKVFNRKALVKDTKNFWEYYFNNIYYKDDTVPSVYKDIYSLKEKNIFKTIISTDMRHQSLIADFNLRGISTIIRCSKCDTKLSKEQIEKLKESNNYKCEKCNSRVRPDCLLYGENYHPKKIKDFTNAIFLEEEGKQVIPNTHTLVLIGVDMQEDLIAEMYDNYLLVKERIEEPCYIVMITDKEEDVRLFTPNFATTAEITNATKRLVELFLVELF
jgi:DNA-directed RNA polymerase subunit RPC12/RpoP